MIPSVKELNSEAHQLRALNHRLTMLMWSEEYRETTEEQRKLFSQLKKEVSQCITTLDSLSECEGKRKNDIGECHFR